MKPLIIHIDPAHEPLLAFLFPTYSVIEGSAAATSRFIMHKDVTSPAQKDALSVYYEDCVFISSVLFDEDWTKEVLIQKCIEYSRKFLRNRKTKFEPNPDSFVKDCVDFMYGTLVDDTESEINELFDAFGSASFVKVFFKKLESTPIAQLQAALNTFVFKILSVSESSSAYYKKKAQVYAPKIKANLLKATDAFLYRNADPQKAPDHYACSVCNFYASLFV